MNKRQRKKKNKKMLENAKAGDMIGVIQKYKKNKVTEVEYKIGIVAKMKDGEWYHSSEILA